MSPSSTAAIQHLKRIRPLDGWSIECKNSVSRLLRRSVPLTDTYFLDIHYDPNSGCVVGILSPPDNGKSQAQVLVDKIGKPTKGVSLVTVRSWDPTLSFRPEASNPRSATGETTLSNEQNMQLLKISGMAIFALMVLRILSQALIGLYILALPLLYVYMVQQCPSADSFDAKKELKRVLRGHHLPEDHPEKPKGFLSETLARINASVATELATGLGYEVTMVPMIGAAMISCVRVPTVKMDYYWFGAFGKWWYVYSTELRSNKND